MGVKDAFVPGRADLSRLSPARLFVSDVVQSVAVIVDEQGTEAAAVTSVVVRATSVRLDAPQPLIFDRPFAFMIVDDASGAVLFMGTVKDPSRG